MGRDYRMRRVSKRRRICSMRRGRGTRSRSEIASVAVCSLLPKTIKEPHSPWHLWWIRVIFSSVMQATGRDAADLRQVGGLG